MLINDRLKKVEKHMHFFSGILLAFTFSNQSTKYNSRRIDYQKVASVGCKIGGCKES